MAGLQSSTHQTFDAYSDAERKMKKPKLKISEKSKSQTLPAQSVSTDAKGDLDRLRDLLDNDTNRQWEIGDTITRLIDRHGMNQRQIAKAIGRHESTLSMLLAVAQSFSPETRLPGVPFVTHRTAAYGTKRAIRYESKGGVVPTVEPQAVLKEMLKVGVKDKRGATRIAQELIRRKRSVIKPVAATPDDRFHHGNCEDIAAKLADGSVKFINMDPPYAQYGKFKDGHHDMSVRDLTKRTECDNNTEADAIRVTVAAIKAWAPKLEPNGCIALWQACKELRLPILQQIHESGLCVEICAVWYKAHLQPGDPATAWTYASEFCWILKRVEGYLLNHDTSNRGNVLTKIAPNGAEHVFQKPNQLSAMFIQKHSNEGDLLVDCFGCSGSFCIEAERLGRRWHYIESNKANFEWGSARIAEAVKKLKHAAA
jgi:hypothetical protein